METILRLKEMAAIDQKTTSPSANFAPQAQSLLNRCQILHHEYPLICVSLIGSDVQERRNLF